MVSRDLVPFREFEKRTRLPFGVLMLYFAGRPILMSRTVRGEVAERLNAAVC